MARKIYAILLIVISSILLGVSNAGIVIIWLYKEPVTQVSILQLKSVENELNLANTALQNAEVELDRTLKSVEAAEKSMAALKLEFVQIKTQFGAVNGSLESQLLPGLKSSRAQIDMAKSSLLNLQDTLKTINALPFLNLNLPGDQILSELISSAGSLDGQISQVEDLVKQASTFLGDASTLMDADFTETKANLQNFLVVVKAYDLKLTVWQIQLDNLIISLPGWIYLSSIFLTVFLLWFGLSQVSLIQNGLATMRYSKLNM